MTTILGLDDPRRFLEVERKPPTAAFLLYEEVEKARGSGNSRELQLSWVLASRNCV